MRAAETSTRGREHLRRGHRGFPGGAGKAMLQGLLGKIGLNLSSQHCVGIWCVAWTPQSELSQINDSVNLDRDKIDP